MEAPLEIPDPRSRDDIIGALLKAEQDVAEFFTSLSAEELGARVGTAWTSLEQLDHLNTAVGAVTEGFAAPKLLLRLRFGRSKPPARSYVELRDAYTSRLAAGGRARGAFVPKTIHPEVSIEQRRDELVERWHRRNERLRRAVGSWSEKQLDTIAMPHPLLGKISAREMLFFEIYHAGHHVAATKQRLRRFAADL